VRAGQSKGQGGGGRGNRGGKFHERDAGMEGTRDRNMFNKVSSLKKGS